ncbi:MAG: hypothetical protein K9G60_08775 [Pseudolabrys sp.]|nr:hypothetical protein [Pseudolabrys sp.]
MTRYKYGVMPGLEPGIHDDDARYATALRKNFNADWPHGLPGQARQ